MGGFDGWGENSEPWTELGLQPRCSISWLSDFFSCSAKPGHRIGMSKTYILRKRAIFTQRWQGLPEEENEQSTLSLNLFHLLDFLRTT